MSTIGLNKAVGTRRNWAMILLLVALVATASFVMIKVFSGFAGSVPAPDSPSALWESHKLDNYRYTLQVSCFCPTEVTRPVVVEIRDGAIASLTYDDDGTAASSDWFAYYAPMENLFTIIADAQAQTPARLDVTYDESYGVPLSVDIDISEMMADEEIRWEITNFEAAR